MKRKPWIKTGIYCIECINNKKKYIGSAVHIKHRWRGHIHLLNSHIHYNKHLQSAWCKYGKDVFLFYIIEECSEDVLREREAFYIELYKTKIPTFGYNTLNPQECFPSNEKSFSICDPHGVIHNGKNVSKFAQKHGLNITSLLGLINGHSRVKSYKGWTLPDVVLQQYKIQNPNGQTFTIEYRQQTEFCKQHNLLQSGLSSIIHHKQKTHKGWKLV